MFMHSKRSHQQKGNQLNGRRYLQVIPMIRDRYPNYIKNSHNSITKKVKKTNMGRQPEQTVFTRRTR